MSASTGADAKPEIQVTPLDKAEAEKTKGVSSWDTWGSPVEKFDWQWSGNEEAYILEGEATITPTQQIIVNLKKSTFNQIPMIQIFF